MSSWVAPAVAAEMWGVSIEHVMAGVANGSICSVVDGNFLFVDMAPIGFAPTRPHSHPPTHSVVTPEELAVLSAEEQAALAANPQDDEDTADSRDVSQWRVARKQTSRLRRPPMAMAGI